MIAWPKGTAMPSFKASIAQVMVFVFFVAVALTALRNANNLWAGFLFTAAILSVCTATVGAVLRRDRAPWIGFALAGWASLLVWLALSYNVGNLDGRPYGFFCELMREYRRQLAPSINGGGPLIVFRQVSQALDVMLTGLMGSWLAWFVARERREDRG